MSPVEVETEPPAAEDSPVTPPGTPRFQIRKLASAPATPATAKSATAPRLSPVTPASPASGSSPLVVLGAGRDGVEGLQELVDEAAVQWGLLRFQFGGGSFVRHKLVFLHFNGEDCPAMRRGQANALTSDAQNLLRKGNQEGFHASLSLTRKAEVTAEEILDRVSNFFVKDDIDFSWQKKTSDAGLQAVKPLEVKAGCDSADGSAGSLRLPGASTSECIKSGRQALRAVGDPFGPWNWVLVHSDPAALPLAGGGSGSVEEMAEFLCQHQDQVLSGLLRLGFGTGRLRRTKHVLVHWVGDGVGAVSRGRMMAKRPEMEKVLGCGLACSVSLELTRLEDLTLEGTIERVRKASIIDDDVVGADAPPQSALSVESFREALLEEQSRPCRSESLAGSPRRYTEFTDWDAEDVVALMHSPDDPLTWALFGPRDCGPRLRKGLGSSGGLAAKSPVSWCSFSPASSAAASPAATPTKAFRWPVPGS